MTSRNGVGSATVRMCAICRFAARKLRLRAVVPERRERLLYCDHVVPNGEGLFRLACENDIECIVAKHRNSPYLPDREMTWFKIRNREDSQWFGTVLSFLNTCTTLEVRRRALYVLRSARTHNLR